MKKNLIIASIVVALAFLSAGVYNFYIERNSILEMPLGASVSNDATSIVGTYTQPKPLTATTTAYLNLAASTQAVTLDFFFNAAASGSKYIAEMHMANNSCSSTNVRWFPVPFQTATSTTELSVATTTLKINPAGGAGKLKSSITYNNVNYRCMRMTLYNNDSSDTSTIWVEAITKSQN